MAKAKSTSTKADQKPNSANEQDAVPVESDVVVLEVRASRDPYRRAGLVLGAKGIHIPREDLSDDQFAALDEDPNVFITELKPQE